MTTRDQERMWGGGGAPFLRDSSFTKDPSLACLAFPCVFGYIFFLGRGCYCSHIIFCFGFGLHKMVPLRRMLTLSPTDMLAINFLAVIVLLEGLEEQSPAVVRDEDLNIG